MNRYFRLLLFFSFCWIPATFGNLAENSHVEAQIVSEVKSIHPSVPFWVGIQFKMEEGWDIYWKNPGDSGIPTTIHWNLPGKFQASDIVWPYPEKINTASIVTFGYRNEAVLLSEIKTSSELEIGKDYQIKAEVDWLACKEICIPGHADLVLNLPTAGDVPPINEETKEIFSSARAHLPIVTTGWAQSMRLEGENIILIMKPPRHYLLAPIPNFQFFPDQPGVIDHAAPQEAKKVKDTLEIKFKIAPNVSKRIDKLKGVLVADVGLLGVETRKAFLISAEPTMKIPRGGMEHLTLTNVLIAFLFSVIGGLILNLMPCVLPVLSIKVLGFVKQAAEEKDKVWKHALYFTFGVLSSFWVFAAALTLIRTGGERLGWGFQLQSPQFVVFLSFIFFLMGLNLLGMFEVGTSLTGVNVDTSQKSSIFGSFISGILATIVATPCTAPFMGSALGFALIQPEWVSFLVFSGLGIGMSLPYLLFSLSPSLLSLVPKPGPWMKTLKQLMALLLFITVLWLAWVLYIETGKSGIVRLMIGFIPVFFGAFILGKWGSPFQKFLVRITARSLAFLLMGAGFLISANHLKVQTKPAMSMIKHNGIAWKEFSYDQLKSLRAIGTPVFIDFTAAWCLSCQVNEQITFGSHSVQEKFSKLGIVAMKADWTMRDAKVTQALQEFGRNGVPLYVLYGRNPSDPPVIFPEIITPGIILKELEKLEKSK